MDELDVQSPAEHDDLEGVLPPAATLNVEGHGDQLHEMTAALRAGRLHHAWLLQGPHGIGKATTAFVFARMLLRQCQESGSHAGEDRARSDSITRQIALGNYPDLLHFTRPPAERGGGFRTQITVEEIRKLNRFFQATVAAGRYRVAIVDPADDMNRSAANALLKILEEPPPRSLFLIVNHTAGRLLPTIRSRCRLLRFRPLEDAELAAAVARALPSASPEDVRTAVARSEGSVRKAICVIVQGGIEIGEKLDNLMAEARPDWNALLTLADSVSQKGREQAYDVTLTTVLRNVADTSHRMMAEGDGEGASRLARFWHDESRRLREAAAYNLDRKQTLVTLFDGFYRRRAG